MKPTPDYGPIRERLARVEEALKSVSDLSFPFLAQILGHVLETGGKRMRPAITLLASDFHPHDDGKPETMATAVELLHLATLIHDDTVDGSDFRRGRATIGSLWGRKAAVLVGDYIFSMAATSVCDTGNLTAIRRFAETAISLSRGELQEMAYAFDCNQTIEQYLERIHNKTASLFATASEAGALLSGAPKEVVRALRDYGHNIGMAFQIVDDILDFAGTEEEVGKPVGSDLSLGIMTLPVFMAIRRYPDQTPISSLFAHPHDKTYLKRSAEMVRNSSAIEDSYAVAKEFCLKARDALALLPEIPARRALEGLTDYVLARRS